MFHSDQFLLRYRTVVFQHDPCTGQLTVHEGYMLRLW
eukprot:Gb_05269 [translate_table: standard]